MRILKQISVSALLILVLGIFSCEDPNSPATEYTVTVTGRVVRYNNTGLDSVIVTLNNPFRRDTVKSDGNFSYSFQSTEKNDVAARFDFTHQKSSYFDTLFSTVYSSTKKTLALGDIKMRGKTPAQDSIITGTPSARAGVIAFVNSSLQTISIRGAGSADATNLTFEVRDSLGIPVDEKNKVSVVFNLVTKPDALVELNRASAVTNSSGQVVVQLSSGGKAGIAQVLATTMVKNAIDTTKFDTLRSPIVSVVIAGGLPVASGFTLGSQKVNIPGLVKFGITNTITAIVGDTFSNPVQKGTLIYFKSNGGQIAPTATTDDDGIATVDLRTALPNPPNGVATITAEVGTPGLAVPGGANSTTIDEAVVVKGLRSKRQVKSSDALKLAKSSTAAGVFTKTITVLFTGAPRVTANDTAFIVPLFGTKQIQFTVDDLNGNPLSEGTSIRITGVGLDTTGAVLSGDLSNTLPDTYDKSYTKFSISIADKRTKNLNVNLPITINVEVTSENGNIKKSFTGNLESAFADSGKVGSISLMNSSVDSIVVTGAGTPNSVAIQAKVLTATNQPSPNIPVNFTIIKSVNGGEYISAPIVFTDANGIATTTIFSGVRSGLVQVQATVRKDTLAVTTDPKNIYIRTGKAASISVVSISSTSLSVKGGGGNENATLVFEAQDSLGNAIDNTNQATLIFSMAGDTNGAKVSPASAKTDPNSGRVTASFSSGTKSGLVQIKASTGSISSPPATIIVSGGFAVDSLFNFTGLQKNYSIYNSTPVEVSVLAGDQYGNPIKPVTPIYFTTDAGVISATSFTDNAGRAQASLQIVNDKKLLGKRFVSARTVSINSTQVTKTKTFILSGAPIITAVNVPSDTVTIFDGASNLINLVIADSLGNPISSGHNYQVQTEGSVATQIALNGDLQRTLQDTDDKINDTKFSFVVSDILSNAGTEGFFKLKITITGVSGTTVKTINGRLLGPANIIVPPSARTAASIALIGASATDLSISGVGGVENATLTYEVRDSVGSPITLTNKATVLFNTNFFPNTFTPGGTAPSILPTLDSTDENGKVRVSILSGTQAGAVQLEAVINLTNPVRTIKSQPVRISINSGFADQNHFTIAPDKYNFPGLQKAFYSMPITIQAGDKYSNPVKEGTIIYFNTANGVVQTANGLTNKDGFVTMSLFSSNPYPISPKLASGLTDGFSRVYARTIGQDSTFVMDSVEILWTGAPIITKTGGPASFTIPDGGSSGPYTFTVADYLSHPMSQNTSIAVDGSSLKISGDANITMVDTKSSGPGLTSFTVSIEDSNVGDTDLPVVSILTVTVSHPVYGVAKLILATGTVD